ncbi:Hypothetical protein RG540_PA05320 (plasmid) [Neorhizobium galegae bv. orientalis str. HAMBI 540]|uniref:Uncharacterized protein n=1 Tax=Neorhizobium galegae bv. orientalis str. HAMBI 540 TaxID=1028800 RepID=A0A068T158_NEOGA|nr:Hypothetical protein RG540_PA05320 [Neorhizobium galegae bv. orientalis str. HAMBI 540]
MLVPINVAATPANIAMYFAFILSSQALSEESRHCCAV